MKLLVANAVWYPELHQDRGETANELTKKSEEFFKDKTYCPEVECFYIFWESTPPGWMELYKQRRPFYIADKTVNPPSTLRGCPPMRLQKYLQADVQVPFEEYSAQTTIIGRWNVIGKAIMNYLREMRYPVVLRKTFDRERFNHDMEEFFHSIGCTLE